MFLAPLPFDIPAFGPSRRSITDTPPPTQPLLLTTYIAPADGLKAAGADQENLRQLANHLRGIALLWNDSTPAQIIGTALTSWKMPIAPGSSYTRVGVGDPSLAQVIEQLGFELPRTKAQAIALRDTLDQKASAPALGNASGSLSWPLPLSPTQQHAVNNILDCNTAQLPGLPLDRPRQGALGYLLQGTPLSDAELQDPHKALEKLLTSPQATALGLAIEKSLNCISTPASLCEHVLGAIQLGLDRESIKQPVRNSVAGFDLGHAQLCGKSASTIVEALKNHLVATDKATQATAPLAAHLLLGRVAPQCLVKDLPDRVVYGSQAWANFCIAAAKVEAEAPGIVPTMTYAQVIQRADQIDVPVAASAQHAALIDWAVANGILARQAPEAYSPQALQSVREAFNDQQNQRLAASAAINTPIPTRKEVALEKLKAHFPALDPKLFELPLLTLDEPYRQGGVQPLYDPNLRPAGYHSMLDVFMGANLRGKWKADDPRIPIDEINQNPDLGILDAFNNRFTAAIDARKSAISTTVRHLIAQLPLEDRLKLENGKISFFHESTYDITPSPDVLKDKNLLLSFKVERDGQRSIYQLDIQNLCIRRKDNYIDLKEVTWTNANLETRQTQFKPRNGGETQQAEHPATGSVLPDSFSSARSRMIADAFVEHLEYDNPAIKQEAKGSTAHEKQLQSQKDVGEFFLNLIPLRSAIVNFSAGNYADGALDLAMDIFSFATAGAGTAAKLAKVGKSTLSTGAKFIKGAKVIGVAAIGEITPLDGVGNLLVGAAKMSATGAKTFIRCAQVVGEKSVSLLTQGPHITRNASGSYDLIKASKAHGVAAIGTFKSADQTIEAVAVQRNREWYAYDPVKNQPFGAPIKDFEPSFTLDPRSPKSDGVSRHTPYSTGSRPARVRVPLPQGEYATAMKGKLEPDHFKPETKQATMGKFVEEMFDHYAALARNPKPRPVIPAVPTSIPAQQLLSDVLKTSDGMVLGELHHQMASFKLLYDNVDTLKNAGVKRVYLEGLLSRPDLPGGLQDDGISMLGNTGKPRSNPSFEDLKAKLQLNGIEIVPIDHYYLTRHKDVKHLYGKTQTGFGSRQRLEEFNYYASKTIEATANGEKWVALVGMSHMKTSERVPGLAEMTGATGVGVFDHKTLPGSSGFGPKVPAPDPTKPLTRNDYPGDLRIFVKTP